VPRRADADTKEVTAVERVSHCLFPRRAMNRGANANVRAQRQMFPRIALSICTSVGRGVVRSRAALPT